MKSNLKNIISILGYDNSPNLYYYDDILNEKIDVTNIPKKTLHIINTIKPFAFYCIDGVPFVMFFSIMKNDTEKEKVFKQVWNSQTAIAIIENEFSIDIYNGYSFNKKDKELEHLKTYDKDIVSQDIDELDLDFSYWNITNKDFWSLYVKDYSKIRIDNVLLDNIRYVVNKLKQSSIKPFANIVILRLIFIRYLIDRGVDLDYIGFSQNVDKSQEELLAILTSKEKTYALFEHLKTKFNGNLFEIDKKINGFKEIDLITDSDINTLNGFMSGNLEMKSGQFSMFPYYDFNIIPIELISNIYERFLGEEKQKNDSAFYTPKYLVDFIIQQTVQPFLYNNKNCVILDPACGSGIFLVESLRQIIESNLNDNYIDDDNKLIKCLTDNIYGVDKNSEAIDVAIFSLYIILLDYKDPKSLKNFSLPMIKNNNFFIDDFFSESITNSLNNISFDFILGNPPWGNIKGKHIEYCKENKIPQIGNEIARSFIARTKDFSNKNTQCCLIVTSKIFYNKKNPSIAFRKKLLNNCIIQKYIELSPVRKLIFNKAIGPAGIIFYKNHYGERKNIENEMLHITLKPNIFFRLFHIIVIEKVDMQYISQDILLKNDWVWKVLVFGNYNDFKLIDNLMKKYPSIKTLIKDYKMISGTGIQTTIGKENPHDSSHLLGRSILDSDNSINSFYINDSYNKIFNIKNVHRTRDENLFKAPYVLIKKGFNIQNYRIRSVYSDKDYLFKDTITAIKGTEDNINTLLSIVGNVNSSLYSYFNIMLGSSSGIEREQVFSTELFTYPIVESEEISDIVRLIQENYNSNNANYYNTIDDLVEKLDKTIFKNFNLQNNLFIDYVLNVQLPLITNQYLSEQKVIKEDLVAYTKIFLDNLNRILKYHNKYVNVKIYMNIKNNYNAIEFIFSDNYIDDNIEIFESNNNLDIISKFMITKYNEKFFQIKDVFNFEENSFYIVKSNEYRNWHTAIAIIDFEDVINKILKGDNKNEWF